MKKEKLPPQDNPLHQWANHILDVHLHAAWNQPLDEEKEDKMMALWEQLTPRQRYLIWDLSEELQKGKTKEDVIPPPLIMPALRLKDYLKK